MRHPLPVPDTDADVVRRLAGAHLPQEVAARWWALLRPAVRLRRAGPGRPVVARFGGLPLLPDIAWPEWPDHGPLSYIGELHCAVLAEHDLDLRGMVWGDVGRLYWLTRGAALRAGDVSFTWQCG